MKKLFIIIFILISLSCEFDVHYLYEPQPINIVSENVFSINGTAYSSTSKYIPFIIYNPNLYAIIITIDEIEHIIPSHNYLTINTPKGERSNL